MEKINFNYSGESGCSKACEKCKYKDKCNIVHVIQNSIKKMQYIDTNFNKDLLIEDSLNLIENSFEKGIKPSEIFLYSAFMFYSKILSNKQLLDFFLIFIDVPKKKQETIQSELTVRWCFNKVTKAFYKPIHFINYFKSNNNFVSNRISEKFLINNFMYIYISNIFKDDFENKDDIFKIIDDYIETGSYTTLAEYLLTCIVFDNVKLIEEIIEYLEKKNILSYIKYLINKVIIVSASNLCKLGKNKSLDFISNDLIDLADTIIEDNAKEIVRERTEYAKIIEKYEKEIKLLKSEYAVLNEKYEDLEIKHNNLLINNKTNISFNNKKVLVVGDSRRNVFYKEVIEKYNGIFAFLDGMDEIHF
jgi:hypothetical protein